MESIINFFMKLWYKLPHVEFVKPIKFKSKDSRSLEWFKERRQFGFDERELWNLSGNLFRKIRISQNSTSLENLTREEFMDWLNSDESSNHITWFYMRLTKYIEWDCPFYPKKCGSYTIDKEGKAIILNQIKDILHNMQDKKLISDKDIYFLYDHIFNFGW